MPLENAPPSEPFQALGESEEFLNLQERISRAAKTDRPVIFIGERGTGKELAASRLHLLSGRWNQPYVTLNCAALTPTLIESELFGHEAGAFTGAMRQRKGRFEMANGGSLFLDEVANIPITVQEKILRVVEYGQMERVGSSAGLTVDARLIAATNVDLRVLAREGRFRQDLLDRLSFEVITLPPLRKRPEDILLLSRHFARRMAAELALGYIPLFSEKAERKLLEYAWPGNVRELKNVVERMVYRTNGETIDDVLFDPFDSPFMPAGSTVGLAAAADAPPGEAGVGEAYSRSAASARAAELRTSAAPSQEDQLWGRLAAMPLDKAVCGYEVERIRAALADTRGNQRRAAEKLGITYHQFRNCFRKYKTQLSEA